GAAWNLSLQGSGACSPPESGPVASFRAIRPVFRQGPGLTGLHAAPIRQEFGEPSPALGGPEWPAPARGHAASPPPMRPRRRTLHVHLEPAGIDPEQEFIGVDELPAELGIDDLEIRNHPASIGEGPMDRKPDEFALGVDIGEEREGTAGQRAIVALTMARTLA